MATSNPALPEDTVASKVSFTELSGLLKKISDTTGNDKKKKVLNDFIEKWRDGHTQLHGVNAHTTNDSFYPCMRLLLPHLEKERVAYGIKENLLAKLLIEVLCLNKDSTDAMKLLHYKAPKAAKGDAGDFASVAYFVLKNRCPERGSLTIADVNKCLDEIATNNTTKKKDLVRRSVLHLLKNLSALEQKWLMRMIVKDMKIGLSQASVLSVYHKDAEEFYNVNNNLEKVCRELRDPSVRVHEIGVSVFSPFSPMLGDKGSPEKIEEVMENQPYFIETKYDGERMLLHKRDAEYKYFSRNGNEYSQVYGGHYLEGTLTPYIANCFNPSLRSCILDGEMLGYNRESKLFGTKAERFDIKSRDVAASSGYEPCLHVFDILLYNDKVLTNLPLRERLTYLEKVFTPVEGRILISEHTQATTNQECVDALNKAIDNREEGIMVKNPSSVYRPSVRKGGWYKIKPEYIGGLMDELDLLIIGGYFGTGHRNSIMSHFLCGVAVPGKDGEKPDTFHSLCKVGTGYTKKELNEYNQRLIDHWNAFDKNKPPKSIVLAQGFKEKPDAWIEPSKSFIIQVKAAEITESTRYKCGLTLRFPRVEKVRDDKSWFECLTTAELQELREKVLDDKSWFECLTTAELQELREKSGGKLAGQKMELTGDEPVKKKRRLGPRVVKPSLGANFRGADVTAVQKVSQMLEGKEMCVINGSAIFPKHDIEKRIAEFGGTFVQNPGEDTMCILADKVTMKVKNLMKNDAYDIVKIDWLDACVQQKRWLLWKPCDMIHTRAETLSKLQQDYDQFGDSYIDHCTTESLKVVFGGMGDDYRPLSKGEIADVEDRHFSHQDTKFSLFRPCAMYIDDCLVLSDTSSRVKDSHLALTTLDVRYHGGAIVGDLHTVVSHVLVHPSDLSRLPELRLLRRARQKKFHIVTPSWVTDCLRDGTLHTERDYEPT